MNIHEIIRHSRYARRLMDFEYIFRYSSTRPAPEVAGYGCEARLRGLDPAIPDYCRKPHKPQATVAEPAFAGYTGFNS
ncbi:MAG: hypothetical protein NZM94_16875, partial [Roseiflexus sp.]|nr:hypothetical protein [Roseiflexus sp.]